MDNFDLRKYLAEGKLFKEELTPLQKYIFDYESDISDNVDMRAIKGLENANDVYDYYANVRGWEGDPDLEDDLDNIYRQVKVKFGEGKLNERQFFNDKQLANDILRNQADVERQLGTKLKDFAFRGDDRVFTAVDPEEFTVYAFKYRDERDPKFPYKDEEPFLSDEGYEPQIIKVDDKKVAVTVGNI